MSKLTGMPNGRPPLFTNAEEVEVLIEDYFNTEAYMMINGDEIFAPTMSGLAYHLNMDRKSLLNYSKKDEFFPTIKKARSRIAAALEQRLYGTAVTGIIFNLKNNFDWKDQTHVETNVSVTLKEIEDMTDDELQNEIDNDE